MHAPLKDGGGKTMSRWRYILKKTPAEHSASSGELNQDNLHRESRRKVCPAEGIVERDDEGG